jgi:hypothetical protein
MPRKLGFVVLVNTMSKPKWAPRHGKWAAVKPGFWSIWHANKDTLQKNGYSVRKSESGNWEVRFIPTDGSGWPPPAKPDAIFVPAGMKASICMKCGHVRLIKLSDMHKDCRLCGEKMTNSL